LFPEGSTGRPLRVADESRIGTRYIDGRRASPRTGPKLLRVRAIPPVGLSSAAPSIEANGGDGDHERQRLTEDRFEMNDELEEPMRIVQLGRTGLYIEPDQAGSYLLHGSDGTVVAAPFSRDDAARFARELLRWAQEVDLQD
jgi:hypothetical protein